MYPLCLLLVQYHGSDLNLPSKYSCILKLAIHILNKMLLLALGMQSLRYMQIICGTYVNHSTALCNFAGGWGWVEGSYPQKKFVTVDIIMLIVQQKIK